MSLKHTLAIAALAAPFFGSGCAPIDPRADYDRVRQLAGQATGRPSDSIDALDSSSDAVRRRVETLLEAGLAADEAVELCLINNPGLAAAYRDVGMARADVVQSGLLANPTLGLSLRLPSGGGLGNFEASLAQNIADLWQIPPRRSAAERSLDQAVLTLAREVGLAAMNARSSYWRAVAAQRLRDAASENDRIADQLLEAARTRRQAGVGSEVEVNLALAETLETKIARRAADAAAAQAARDLFVQLGLSDRLDGVALVDPLPSPSDVAWNEDEAIRLAVDSRLDLRSARAASDAAGAQWELQLRRIFPSLDLGVAMARAERGRSKGRDRPAESLRNSVENGQYSPPNVEPKKGRHTDFIIGPTLGLELPIFDQNQAQIARAALAAEQAEWELDALLRRIIQDVRLAHQSAQIARDVAKSLQDELLPLRERNLQMARDAYRAGGTQLVVVLDAQRNLALTRGRCMEALRDAAMSLVSLEQAVGRPLESPIATPASSQPTDKHDPSQTSEALP